MSNLPADTLQHVTMRWRGDDAASPATAIRLERLLSMMDWRPAGMKPGQVLLIKRLVMPKPLRLTQTPQFNWEAELRQMITELYRQAVYPLNGYIPPAAISLIFDDAAHLLICLTLDVLERESSFEHWYWQQVVEFRVNSSVSERIADVWVRYVAALPPALAQLTGHQIKQLAELMQPADVLHVLRALALEWGVSLPPILFTSRLDTPEAFYAPRLAPTQAAISENEMPRFSHIVEPWEGLLPVSSRGIPILMKVLLGWSAVLRAAPAHGRSPVFMKELATWLVASQSFNDNPTQPIPAQSTSTMLGSVPVEPMPRQDESSATPAQLSAPAVEPERELNPAPLATGVYTQLGGALFLINLLSSLGWLEDVPTQVSRWAVVEALTRALLIDQVEAYADDELWLILASLASRPFEERLDLGLSTPLEFRLPANWLQRIGSEFECRAHQIGDRIVLVDSEHQFVICDMPLAAAQPSDTVLEVEVANYQAMGIRMNWTWGNQAHDDLKLDMWTAALLVTMDSTSAWWVARLSSFVRFWLPAALGEPVLSAEAAIETLLQQAGQLDISNTHIDLYLPMALADIRLRRVGLDRDPGWVPELGYIIQFHYFET